MIEPRTMRAAILVVQREPLVVDEVELPAELSCGQVLVRVLASGVCGSQLGEIDGVKGSDPHLPHLLGHEGSGSVTRVGPGVKRTQPGDHVVLHWRKASGIDAEPPVYSWRGRRLNAGCVTTFNEYAVVSENRLTPVPPDLDPEVAALLGCPVTTGLGIVAREARLSLGESIVVIGTGGVGLSVVQGAALAGALPIVAVDVRAPKLDLARRLGATHVVDANAPDVAATVRRAVGDEGADIVVESTGQTAAIELAYKLTHARGRTILAGVPRWDEKARLDTLPLHFGKTLTGSHGGGTRPEEDIPRYLRLHAAGRLDLKALVTDRATLDQVNDAIARIRKGDVTGRCVLRLGSP